MLFLLLTTDMEAQKLSKKDVEEMHGIMARQQECWNEGDIECFMEGYWKSDDLRFMGKKGVTRGWKQTLERYKKSYPDRKAMGKLKFEIISTELLSKRKALIVGKWHLTIEDGDKEGHFSLIWEKQDGHWVIVLDHSS